MKTRTELTTRHCEDFLNTELLIGSDQARDGRRKRFFFHVWNNEYRVKLGNQLVDSGQDIEALLNIYNDL